jgi:hypothetical protein
MLSSYRTGNFVYYGPRLGLIIEEDPVYTTWNSPLYKVFFFDVRANVFLDESVLKLATNLGPMELKLLLHEFCECGAKHVDGVVHSSWCISSDLLKGGNCVEIKDVISVIQSRFTGVAKGPVEKNVSTKSDEKSGDAKK